MLFAICTSSLVNYFFTFFTRLLFLLLSFEILVLGQLCGKHFLPICSLSFHLFKVFSIYIIQSISGLRTLCLAPDLEGSLLFFSRGFQFHVYIQICDWFWVYFCVKWDRYMLTFFLPLDVQHHLLKGSFLHWMAFAPLSKSFEHIYMVLFLTSLFYSIDWCIYPSTNTVLITVAYNKT